MLCFEHEAVELDAEQFQEYLATNYQRLHQNKSKEAKRICFQLWERFQNLKQKNDSTLTKLKKLKIIEKGSLNRQQQIQGLTKKLQEENFSSNIEEVKAQYSRLQAKITKEKKAQKEIFLELQVLYKLRTQNPQKNAKKILLLKEKQKISQQNLQKWEKQWQACQANLQVLKRLSYFQKIENQKNVRLQKIKELEKKNTQEHHQMVDYRNRIASLEQVFHFSFHKEREAWKDFYISSIIIVAVIFMIPVMLFFGFR